MRAPDPTATAGLVSTSPSTATRPSSIQRSASRREHRPARAMILAIRCGFPSSSWSVVIVSAAPGLEWARTVGEGQPVCKPLARDPQAPCRAAGVGIAGCFALD